MKAGFVLPSCNYNIVLSKEDIQQLLETGHIIARPSKDRPCTVRSSNGDVKDGYNDLRFFVNEELKNFNGEEEGNQEWWIQFLTINLEK